MFQSRSLDKGAVAKTCLLFVITIVLCLVATEVLVRFLFADTIVLFPRYHTHAQYGDFTLRRLRPREVFWHRSVDGAWKFTTNSKGFRSDTEYPYEKPEGAIRVLVLGDSHTQGFEVNQDETYSSVLERLLAKRGYNIQVLNTGISGFSTAEQLAFLENEGVRYDPDFVVLGFYANDLEDNIKAGLFALDSQGTLSVRKTVHIPGVRIQNFVYALPFTKWLGENSYAYAVLFNAVWNFFKELLAESAAEETQEYAIATRSSYSSYEIDLAAALIRRAQEVAEMGGAQFILVDIPQPSNQARIISSLPDDLREALLPHVGAFVDSAELLSARRGAEALHVPHGHRHISAFTHSMIGTEIARRIEVRQKTRLAD